MKILLLTVAGLSSRFSKSVGKSCVKCLYYRDSFEESLLSRMLKRHLYFDKIVVVGGYEYELLKGTIDREFPSISDKLILVENEHYEDFGSGYSLYMGYKAIEQMPFEELVFAEGDLFLDDETFDRICNTKLNVMTYNGNPIESDKSVAFYLSVDGKPHYIYDTAHNVLEIREPFLAIYNSGQVWKFTDSERLGKVFRELAASDLQGTNLVPINAYFQALGKEQYELIGFQKWINCNTVEDFNMAMEVKPQ